MEVRDMGFPEAMIRVLVEATDPGGHDQGIWRSSELGLLGGLMEVRPRQLERRSVGNLALEEIGNWRTYGTRRRPSSGRAARAGDDVSHKTASDGGATGGPVP